MTTESNPSNPAPSQQDAMAVGQAAAQAAATAPQGQEQQAAATAIRQEAADRNIRLSDDEIKAIATMAAQMASAQTISDLEKRGAFREESTQPPAQSQPAQPAQSQQSAPAQPEPESNPRKRTLAERWGFSH